MRTSHDAAIRNNPILTEMVARLVRAFQPEQIYLFGSQAQGTADSESDYDLLMIVTTSRLPRYRRDQAAFRILTGVGASKDVLVLTREEFDRSKTVFCSLPATIEREGMLLYAA
jgi:predicted nucleotidyltransferase